MKAEQHRPSQVGVWIKRARLIGDIPLIKDLEGYADRMRDWWRAVQPSWRKLGGDPDENPNWPLPRDVPEQSEWDKLKKGGRIVFVEYRKEDPSVPIKEAHKMTVAQVRKEMTPFPLDYRGTSEILPRQHIITFVKR